MKRHIARHQPILCLLQFYGGEWQKGNVFRRKLGQNSFFPFFSFPLSQDFGFPMKYSRWETHVLITSNGMWCWSFLDQIGEGCCWSLLGNFLVRFILDLMDNPFRTQSIPSSVIRKAKVRPKLQVLAWIYCSTNTSNIVQRSLYFKWRKSLMCKPEAESECHML